MRLWQTTFQVVQPIRSLPIPDKVVCERYTPSADQMRDCRPMPDCNALILCSLSGEGWFKKEDGRFYPLPRGKAFMHVPGPVDITYGYPAYGSEPWEFICFSFSGDSAIAGVREMMQRYGDVIDLPMDKGLIKHLTGYYAMRNTVQILAPTAGAKVVFDALAALGETLEGDLAATQQELLIRDAQRLIQDNLDRTLDIALIAEKLNVSREHLTRVFHSRTGQSPGQYALEMRMKTASRLLHDNKLSCKEIAERIGYESPSSFARVFRSCYSVSPTQFRESLEPGLCGASFSGGPHPPHSCMTSGAEPEPYRFGGCGGHDPEPQGADPCL